MTAKELRLGNLFIEENTKEIISVIGLEKDRIIFSGMFLDKWQALPIELNKEWFKKLGMTYYSLPTKSNRSVGYYTLKFGNRFKINNSDGNYSFINFRKEIKYVHQLQNLYFALTNEELTLNK